MNILDISPMGIYPPYCGGHLRIHNLNLELSKYHKIFLFSQNIRRVEFKFPIKPWTNKINSNYVEYRYINTPTLITSYIFSKWNIPNLLLDEILRLYNPKILKNKINDCDIIQVEHPWQFKGIYNIANKEKPIILDSHNVEYDLINQFKNNKFLPNIFIKTVWKKEKFAVENANVVFMVSKEDKNRIHELYGISKSKIHIIPNGTCIPDINILNCENKRKIKEKYGFENKKIILYIGTKYLPNIEAVNKIIEMSKSLNYDNALFVIAGSVGELFNNIKYKNIVFTGFVDNISDYFKMADIAINPMLSGSGTNIKMLEYMSYGLPIITTDIGARGIDIKNKKHAIICNINEFPYWIETLLTNEDLRITLGNNARKLAEMEYDWKVIAEKVNKIYKKLG